MAARMATSDQGTLPTRVSVLEHGVQELRTGLDGHRNETRAGFQSMQATLERVIQEVANRAHPTNWIGIISAAAATVGIVAAVFSLSEWRVGTATAPLYELVRASARHVEKQDELIVNLRVMQAVQAAEAERVKVEQAARIKARVEAENTPHPAAK